MSKQQTTPTAPAEKRVVSVPAILDEVRHVCRLNGIVADKANIEVISFHNGHASCGLCGAAWSRGKRGAR